MQIGRFVIGIRKHRTNKFHLFYNPLLSETESEFGIKMRWIGWHIYVTYQSRLKVKH